MFVMEVWVRDARFWRLGVQQLDFLWCRLCETQLAFFLFLVLDT